MKEVNLADYVKGADPVQNRSDFWAALAACKAQRAHSLYVPDPEPGVVYKMAILAADKMTTAQVQAGEPGDSAIARFLVDWDLEIYGDGWDHSVLSFGSDVAGLQFAGLKMMFPFSLTLRGVRVTSHTPMASGVSPMTYGVYVPPKTGNPTTENRLLIEKSKVDWFGDTVAATAGPVHAVNRTSIGIFDSEIRGQKVTVGIWNDPDDDGSKNLHVERTKLFNTDKNSGWGSHLMYIHENVSWRAINTGFFNWATAKYGIQNWGSNPNGKAKYSEAQGCNFDGSGDGPAIITSDTGPCQVSGGRVECRQGFQARQRLVVTDVLFRPLPTIGGTIACLSTYDNAEVVARNLIFDMSEIGDNQSSIFGISNNNSVWDIDGARIDAKKRTASLTIYATAPNITHGLANVKSRNVTVNGYHVPDADYAAGVRSVTCLVSGHQANWDLAKQYVTGDMVSDRGALRFDGNPNVLGTFKLEDSEIVALRGLGMYSDLPVANKIETRRVKFNNARLVLVNGAHQRLRFNEAKAPVAVVPVTTRLSSDWAPFLVLPIGTDYDTVVLTGNPADPVMNVMDICVNLIRKTQTKPAVPATPTTPAQLAVTYTDVYVSEDTDNFVDAPLAVVGEISWRFRGIDFPVGQRVDLVREKGLWVLA